MNTSVRFYSEKYGLERCVNSSSQLPQFESSRWCYAMYSNFW